MKSIVGTAELNATTFHYEMAGIGPPVVLIHAGIADSRMWEGQFAPLSRWFRVIRYDMRGFGLTPPAEGAFSHMDDLAALLRHLGIERVSLIGCSMGSKTALDFALAHPAQVDRLVLTSPAVGGLPYDGPPPPQAEELDAADAAAMTAQRAFKQWDYTAAAANAREAFEQVSLAAMALNIDMTMDVQALRITPTGAPPKEGDRLRGPNAK